MTLLKLALAQINPLVGDIEGNTEQVIAHARKARDELSAQVVVFPELVLCGYPPEDLLLRQGLYPRVWSALERVRREVNGIDVVLGYPEQTADGVYNSVCLIRDGEVVANGRKQHLPNYSVFDEKRYFQSGPGYVITDIQGVKIALLICEDVWLPTPMQEARAAGAQMALVINASPFHIDKGQERERALADRIGDTNIPVLYVNQVGGQDELVFDGGSFIMDNQAQVTQRVPLFVEGLFPVEIACQDGVCVPQPAEIAQVRTTEATVYDALVTGVRDYVNKNGFAGVVIGLSGGIDSALTLAVAVDALGAERVEAVMMPSQYTREMSLADAEAEAKSLGVDYQVIPIQPLFEAFLTSLAHEFEGRAVDTTEENIQARCRGVLLMAISNKKRRIVLTTGNKSEMAVGYATLYGDMAGGFDVLKDVPKTLVYRLSIYRNTLGPVIPQRVIDRPPSAELAPDQEDSDSLPDYDILDAILERYVEQDQCLEDIIAAGYDADTVARVIRMVDRNEYKRRQAAPGVRVTRRAFGRDRRYPITSGFGRKG